MNWVDRLKGLIGRLLFQRAPRNLRALRELWVGWHNNKFILYSLIGLVLLGSAAYFIIATGKVGLINSQKIDAQKPDRRKEDSKQVSLDRERSLVAQRAREEEAERKRIEIETELEKQRKLADRDAGWEAYQRGSISEGLRLITPLAEEGDAVSQYYVGVMQRYSTLGRMFFSSESRDYVEAEKWFKKAAEQGHAQAQYELGEMYIRGLGVTKNEEDGLSWLRRAAEQGDTKARERLCAIQPDCSRYRFEWGVQWR